MRVKPCAKCRNNLDCSQFHKNKNNSDGLAALCKGCVTEYSKQRWAKNKDAESLRSKQWRAKNTDYLKVYEKGKNNRKRYWPGLTNTEAYDVFMQMREAQNECCAICNEHESKFAKGLVVDHCHQTLKVRQLLCQNCNAMIGMAKESELVLKRAIKYLSTHNKIEGDVCANF